MAVLSLFAALLILFALAWRTRQTLLEIAPYLLCAMGLALYGLAFACRLSLIDWLLLPGGAAALVWVIGAARREGRPALIRELSRQFGSPYLWGCLLLLGVMCFALRHELILEWDAYNFWGPDIKSLFFRDGFAAKYSNAAQNYGDYTPVFQLIMWWFVHLFGDYQERYIYYGYFIFSGLMLFSAGAVFYRRFPRARAVSWLLVPFCALCLPGVCSTAWYRSICVDPIMAILFGMLLSRVVMRPERCLPFWKGELLAAAGCLALMKSMGLLWGVAAAVFYLLWWGLEKREYRFSLALLLVPLLLAQSWSVYCRVMERAGYLASSLSDRLGQRLAELADGTFLASDLTRGYILSYIKAFFVTPVHREATFAIDLSPFAIAVMLVGAVVLLWYFGAVPAKKLGRLFWFTLLSLFVIYLLVSIGQLTLFYDETQYLEPVNAVTLMSRYCETANTGLLMLMVTLASGAAPGAALRHLRQGRQWLLSGVAALVLLSCAGYREAWRRFVYDELDASRVEKRLSFEEAYQPFIQATAAVPYRESGSRVLLVLSSAQMNPIVINAVSPVSFAYVSLSQGGEADYTALLNALSYYHCGYLYLMECADSLLDELPEGTQRGQLYRAAYDGQTLSLQAM